jgi:hypothetical protein
MTQRKPRRYYDLNTYFRQRFGERVHKLSVDAGLTCPNRDGSKGTGGCIYCNPRGSGTGAHARGMSVGAQLEASKAAVARRFKAHRFVAYFQSFSNTYAPLAQLKAMYDEALAVPDVVGLAVGTRPDCVDEAVLALLAHYARHHLVWIEYGLQSAHDATLARIHRGHTVAAFRKGGADHCSSAASRSARTSFWDCPVKAGPRCWPRPTSSHACPSTVLNCTCSTSLQAPLWPTSIRQVYIPAWRNPNMWTWCVMCSNGCRHRWSSNV